MEFKHVKQIDKYSVFLGIRIKQGNVGEKDVKIFESPSQDAEGYCVHRVSSLSSLGRQVERIIRNHNAKRDKCRCFSHNPLWSTYVRRAKEQKMFDMEFDDAVADERVKSFIKNLFVEKKATKKAPTKKITSGLRSKLEMLRDEDDRQKQSGFAGMTPHERGVIDRKLGEN
tara:strand:+ start:414 stop:926 length:513 start_codon:yes stop_codon:yes gene_type:complete